MQLKKEQQFEEIIYLIRQAKIKTICSINKEIIELYWNIGCYISKKIENSIWGESVIEELAKYLKTSDPSLK